jgi:hypothetical protein
MLTWQASGGCSLDASVRIHGSDSAQREPLLRYCARPPFALERMRLERHADGRATAPRRPSRPHAGPPQHDFGFDADPGFDIDQTPIHDPTEPEPVTDFDFDQSHGA